MLLPFREISMEDKQEFEACSAHYNYYLCEHCFVDMYMWRNHYATQICFRNGFALVRMTPLDGGPDCYLAPIGEGNLGDALDALEADATERGIPLRIVSVAEPMIERIEAVRPGKYDFIHDSEDGDDYIYLAEKLRTLSGKKLQSKRNLVNRFKAAYEGRWSYEDMTGQNTKDAFGYHIRWCKQNGCAENRDFQGETCAIVQALHYFDRLNLRGGLLRLDGEVIAFTFGCKAAPDLYVVQIEKADHSIPGAYQMINQQFVLHNCGDVEYVNREEDLGLEGLRKAKKSYYPAMRGVKYTAVPKGGQA
nr:phosphatidylglycerol lysyltransferase domain-containing protein [uncultured Agathobaculum sp.]